MNAETTFAKDKAAGGSVFYDAECSLCLSLATWAEDMLRRRGFSLVPLQTPAAAERLGVPPSELFGQMHLLTGDGRRFGGADAVVEIARRIGWAWPLVALAHIPGMMPVLCWLYARVAANRYCISGACSIRRRKSKRVFFEMP